jgi:hypothetical protein
MSVSNTVQQQKRMPSPETHFISSSNIIVTHPKR